MPGHTARSSSERNHMKHRTPALCAATLLLVAGCGTNSTGSNSTAAPSGNSAGTFVLSESKIALDGTIPAGPVTVAIDNQGGETHELVIVAADNVDALPKKSDGSVDEDKLAEADKIGERADIASRTSTTATFTFEPGSYVAFCNLIDDMGMSGGTKGDASNMPMGGNTNGTMMDGATGHVHFAEGMYVTFTVT